MEKKEKTSKKKENTKFHNTPPKKQTKINIDIISLDLMERDKESVNTTIKCNFGEQRQELGSLFQNTVKKRRGDLSGSFKIII